MTRHLIALIAVLAAPSFALAAGDSGRGLMDIVWTEMLFTIIVFGIFFTVLSTVVWPKILGGLQAREDKQRNDLVSAEKAKKEAEAALAEYNEKLAEARKEAQSIVAEARTAAQQAANADKAKIEAEVASMKASAKADIAAAREAALADIYTQAASLSTTIAGKILKREINEGDQQGLVNESIEQFKNSANSN
ncbi:F0F1 ATP synthase subunit B [Algisphaera agarilytica]|uniref:ATP synthase subunit b n=1 Tax=Algisphaera agarilytica TaxID=1385975 RepID=A0A7X0LLX2_9BACT|nr:F0F1 ATP synthase subunit B [Algisphaera agarilytica]MBB6430413.1 F-type H+-transporting ATPase subunit b [Algisphaera agarilytica]